MATKYLDDNGLLYFWQKIKTALSGKVDSVSGKGLSTNDLTAALKSNYDAAYNHSANVTHAPSTAQQNVLESVKVNNTALPITNKAVNVVVPTKVSELPNDSDYATKAQVASAVANANHLKREKVSTLPAVSAANENTIYMVPKSGAAGDVFNEYMLIDGKFELMGSSSADLTGYLKTTDVATITNAEIDTITVDGGAN